MRRATHKPRNPLKSLESDEGIQGNPNKIQGFPSEIQRQSKDYSTNPNCSCVGRYGLGCSPSSSDGTTNPVFGSIQHMWSCTATQPGVFSATTLRPSCSRT